MMAATSGPYLVLFIILAIVCAGVVARSRSTETVQVSANFKKFQRNFLLVYLVMMMADWLQGPYVYALYAAYGFSHGDIAFLFIVGFGSSMVFGTFVGGLADRFGRKANCVVFGVLYSLCCLTKHSHDFSILLIGRVLGGISTSILMSAFETWMVHEHKKIGYPDEWLSHTFALMTFGNGIVAIVAGLAASMVAGAFNIRAPFDLSLLVLVCGTIIVLKTWEENYGDQFATGFSNFRDAWAVLVSNEKVALLGIIQSCFESAMFIFVFEWTPALESSLPEGSAIPHGLIFAIFMVCIMIGSNIFKSLCNWQPVEHFARMVFGVSAVVLFCPVIVQSHLVRLLAFCVFELCCGIYFPSMGVMRGKYVPEEVRATMMNIFRVGLNLVVVLVLTNVDKLKKGSVFLLCSFVLAVAALAQHRLFVLVGANLSPQDRARIGADDDDDDEQLVAKQDAQA